jgi:hypothetical protein
MKVISGGQTGVDIGGLLAARDVGYNTGGYAAKGYRNENGYKDKKLQQELGLIDNKLSYKERTQANIEVSDATIIVAKNLASPGTALTLKFLTEFYHKPYFVFRMTYKQDEYNMQKHALIYWLLLRQCDILNIGGNRESVVPGIQKYTYNMLTKIFTFYDDKIWEEFIHKKLRKKE